MILLNLVIYYISICLVENFFKRQLLGSKISVFISILFSVIIIGLLGLLIINYNSIKGALKESISFNLIINDSVQELETQQLIRSLNLIQGIKSVNYISKQESAQHLINHLGEDFLNILGENPLKNIIELNYYSNYIETMDIKEQTNKFLEYDQIDEVAYDSEILLLLERNFKKLGTIFLIIALFFFLIAFLLINSNIRLTIYSKRFIIKTMQMVGATKKFIQKPFIFENLLSAIFACVIGSGLLLIIFFIVRDKMPEMQSFMSLNQLIYVLLISSGLNLGISFFSTCVCVRKYLSLKTDQLYK